MTRSSGRSCLVLSVLAILAAAGSRAAEVTVQNDALQNGGTAIIQAGFVANEQAATWLTSPCTGNIVAVQVMWLSLTGGAPDSLEDSITIYADGTFPTPGAMLDEIVGPVMVDGYLNEFRYKDQLQTIPLSVPINSGQVFVVSFRFLNDPDPGNGPSVVTDSNGCQAGKNGLYASPPNSWFNACSLGVSGDWVIRAVVSGPTCSSTATGACCNSNGTCTDGMTQGTCSAGGGTWQGANSTCSGTNCPPPPVLGACCLTDGTCTESTAALCTSNGGTYQGDGTLCANTNCPQPTNMDFLVGQGLGQPNPNEVRGYTETGGATTVRFNAYGAGAWGVNVAAGDVDGGTTDEILTGPGPGDVFGPQVRGFQALGSAMGKINYYAYGTLKYGVNVASSDPEVDAFDEILTGPGPGAVFGPHVRGWNFDATSVTAMAKISYFAYGTLKYGVNVGSGDVDGEGFDELLTAPGPGAIFGPQVRGFNYDGGSVVAISKINFNAFSIPQYGANLAGGNVDADVYAEIACAPGPGPGSSWPAEFRGFNYDNATIGALPGFITLPYGTWIYGGRVGLGDVSGDGPWDLLTAPGRDPNATSNVQCYDYTGATLQKLTPDFEAFPGARYGVNVAGGALGY